MKKNAKNQGVKNVVKNAVKVYDSMNLDGAHIGARDMNRNCRNFNQTRKSMCGNSKELVRVGKDADGKYIYMEQGDFLKQMGVELSANGNVSVSALRGAWNPLLMEEGRLRVCKNVRQYATFGKEKKVRKALFTKNAEGEYVPLNKWMPAKVGDNSWTVQLICDGISQSHFIAETEERIAKSAAAFIAADKYVYDEITEEYVAVKVK